MKKLCTSLFLLLCFFAGITKAQLVNNGETLYIGNSGLLYVDQGYVHNFGTIFNDGEMIVTGNWTNNNINSRVFDPASTGINRFIGTNFQLGGSGLTQFPQLAFYGNGTVTLTSNIEARLILDIDNKEIVTGSKVLSLTNPSATSLVRAASGFINTNGGGSFLRKTNKTDPYLFPVGVGANFRPVVITPQDNQSNTYSIALIYKDPSNDGYTRLSKRADINEINDKYYYKISRPAGTSNSDFSFFTSSNDGDFNGVTSWVGDRIWEKNAPVKITDGTFYGSLSRSVTYSLINNNALSAPVMNNMPFGLTKVADMSNPLVIFNAFSPDGDGKNDRWYIKNIDSYPENDIKIYDRSGNTIYKTNNYNETNAWDGDHSAAGTYFYVLRVKINNDYKYYKGSVTLIRK